MPRSRTPIVLAICAVLGILAFAAFSPTLRNGFVNYDDNQYVYENLPVKAGLSMAGAKWAFTGFHAGNWHPVTWLSHMLDCQFYGLKPWGHHLTNVLLHAANAVLLFLVLVSLKAANGRPVGVQPSGCPRGGRKQAKASTPTAGASLSDRRRLGAGGWCSAAVVALWAVHPLRVESVAWVSERKDLLGGLFFLLTLLAYARYAEGSRVEGRRSRMAWYLLVVLFFALGLMSKPMLVTLPFVLLLLDYWPLRRTTNFLNPGCYFLILEKLPLLLLSAASCVVTLSAQKEAMVSGELLPLLPRMANAAGAYVSYLGQTLWPVGLTVFHPWPEGGVSTTATVWACLLLAGITAAVWLARRRCPAMLVGWLWYLGMLVPVIGLVQVGDQAHADRYTYLPQIGILILLVWGIAELPGSSSRTAGRSAKSPRREVFAGGAIAAVVAALFCGTWIQISHWRDSVALWTRNLKLTPPHCVTHNNLGFALKEAGRPMEAEPHVRKALELKPDFADAHGALGQILFLQGRLEEADLHFQQALKFDPSNAVSHFNAGLIALARGRVDEGIEGFERALQLNPNYPDALSKKGAVLAQQGKFEEAEKLMLHALRVKPDYAEPLGNLALIRERQGRLDEAVELRRRAVRIDPASEANRRNLETALEAQRKKRAGVAP